MRGCRLAVALVMVGLASSCGGGDGTTGAGVTGAGVLQGGGSLSAPTSDVTVEAVLTPTATLRLPTVTPTATATPRSQTPAAGPTATPRPVGPTATPEAVRPTPTAVPPATATPTPRAQLPTATPTPRPLLPSPTPARSGRCDPSYPTVCIPPPPPDLDCGDLPYRRFPVLPPDPHRLDRDGDGVGCETG